MAISLLEHCTRSAEVMRCMFSFSHIHDFLLTEYTAILGEYPKVCTRKTKGIFSKGGPELGRVNKELIIWLLLYNTIIQYFNLTLP